MKPLRALGVIALTIAALSLIGTSDASATVLCTNSGCTTAYASGTTIHYTLKSGTSSILKDTSGNTIATCTGSTISSKTTSESGTSISANIESLTWSGCSQTTDTVNNGSLSISWTSGSNGSVSGKGSNVTMTVFGVSCTYGTGEGTTLGTLTGGETPVLAISAVVPKTAGGFLCPSTGKWTAEYVITEPHALYVGKEKGGGGGATSTSLTTSLSGEEKSGEEITVNEGSKVKDTATLSGTNASKATGTVKYKVYADKECKELVTSAGEVTVSEGKVPASEEKELEAGRVYYWQAEYSGDTNNLSSKSTCGKEVLTVKAKTSLSTSLSGGEKSGEEITVDEGSKVKDTATLSGTKSSTATGKVKFKIYKDKECKELAAEAGEGSLSEGKASSEEKTLEAGAVYYWQAEYPGDSLHLASTSSCGKEVLTVKAETSLSTTLSGGGEEGAEVQVEEADAVKDKATLSGTNSSKATGIVKYKIYSDNECKELAATAGEVTVSGGSVPSSSEVKLSDGFYYWQASYQGDSTHSSSTSACGSEIEVVAEETTLATTLHGESGSGEALEVEEGAWVVDTAALSGANTAEATGEVRFNVYGDKECEELVADAGTIALLEEAEPVSDPAELPAGTYYWQAEYFGDSHNQPSISSCGTEILHVVKPPLTTSLSGESQTGEDIEVEEGAPVTDTATINEESSSSATGTIEYSVYADSKCEELVSTAGEVTVTAGIVPPSEEVPLPSGIYYWQATYSGDLSHKAATSPCGSEIERVAAGTSLTTSLAGESESGTEIEVREGAAVSDKASLSGPNASMATGDVAYTIYADSECEEPVAHVGSVEVAEGSVPSSEEVELPLGTYYWQAKYFGDSLNQPSTSACGTEVELVTSALLTNELSGGGKEGAEIEVEEKVPVFGTATLHEENAATATGTVQYSIYADGECKELITAAGEVTVAEGKIPVSSEVSLTQGDYYWQSTYSGDKTHEAATSPCRQAVQKVALPWVVSVGDSYISGEGGRWAGNTASKSEWKKIDALGKGAYRNPLNGELVAEAIEGCHRSSAAEIFIQVPAVNSRNFACSGAETMSSSEGTWVVWGSVWKTGYFKPGLDFADASKGQVINAGKGRCGLAKCEGQARMLREFAKTHAGIKMVVVSIGGNDFGFPSLVKSCVYKYLDLKECNGEPAQKAAFEKPSLAAKQKAIEDAIGHVGQAMEEAGYAKAEYTILVQDYPSPIPNENRYKLGRNDRINIGGCALDEEDMKWANATALNAIDETVLNAVNGVKAGKKYNLEFMELKEAFNGRRLCEKGQRLVGDAGNPALESWTQGSAVDESEWVNQLRLITLWTEFDLQEDFHPNYWGQLALRNCVRQAYNNGLPKSGACTIQGKGLFAPPQPRPLGWDWEPKMQLK